ncbi:MAG: hypothetical protein NXH75_03600 [Halobacteriovoraceae bacterium]|nr:hypothetical protein [Halobacteriovoraceae bacterium]
MFKEVILMSFIVLISSSNLEAKAPHSDGMEISSEQERIPAQNNQGPNFPKLDDYLDMNCQQLTDEKSKDEFIRFFRKELKSINPDICSIVTDEAYDEDQLASQAERKTIGLGTFSKLVEVHFNDYIYDVKLNHYQDLACSDLMVVNSKDSFIKYFSQKMDEEQIKLCDNGVDYMRDMDEDRSQAEMPIGEGTRSKIIEIYYEQFHYSNL